MNRTEKIAIRGCALLLAASALVAPAGAQALWTWYEGPNAGDRLGYVRALGDLDGDGADEYAIGAPGMTNSDGYQGVVTVYSGRTDTDMFEVRGDAHSFDFGYALGAAGDYNGDTVPDFIVGDPADDTFASLSGIVSVYSGLTGGWMLSISGTSSNLRLGAAVAGVGDMTGDGRSEFAFGVPGEDKVVVYSKTGSSHVIAWSWNGQTGSTFGGAVAAAGDVDADGTPDIVIGAPGYDPSGKADVGRAYVYSGATGGLLWTATGSSSYDYLAFSVAGVGDVNGDGYDDVFVGCDQDDSHGTNTGKATVHSGEDGAVLYTLYGYGDREYFGTRVAGVGDLNGDGTPDLAVSTWNYNDIGRITTFSGIDGMPFHDTYDHSQGEQWGNIDAGDFDGDGDPDLILGTPKWVDSVAANGRVEIYRTCKAVWENYGTGWPGTKGVPVITGVSGPWIGRTADVFVENSSGVVGGFALLLLGLDDASIVTNKGGTLLVDPLLIVPFTFPFAAGITLSGKIPDDGALCDFEFFLQAIELDPGASKGLSFTDGLKGRIGFEYP